MTSETLRLWLKQADLDDGKRHDGLTSDEQEELRRLRRENPDLAGGTGNPEKSRGLLRSGDRRDPVGSMRLWSARRPSIPSAGCAGCWVSPRAAIGRGGGASPLLARRVNAQLTEHILQIHQAEPRHLWGLAGPGRTAARGMPCGHNRVARLMRQAGLVGCHRRRPVHVRTTRRDPAATPAPDLVERSFAASGPDRLWIADITYLPTEHEGFLYLAVILDVFSPQSGGLVDAGPSADRTGPGRLGDGGEQAAAGGRAHPPFRSWLPVYLGALR